MEFFQQIEVWHWLILALLLLGGEVLGAAGFMLGAVAAALTMSLLLWLDVDLSWQQQISIFAALSLVFSIIYWKRFRRFNQATETPQLNDRAAQLVGRQFTLDQSLVGGQGKQQIGDTLWKVQADSDLAAGTQVKVVAGANMALHIEAV